MLMQFVQTICRSEQSQYSGKPVSVYKQSIVPETPTEASISKNKPEFDPDVTHDKDNLILDLRSDQ